METQQITIGSNQYFRDIEPFKSNGIPTNTIIHKTITGCGATTLEIEWKRHSIIIEPNVPVIEGKCDKYNTKRKIAILGVFENTLDEDIVDYLQGEVMYKKFLVTPESFPRLMIAIGSSTYEDYFLLFDECERAIQDVAFRGNIILPMEEFFLFKEKAFISATPILPSDPRFKHYKFSILQLKPTFDHRENVKVISTNNIIISVRRWLNENKRDQYFIFLNSGNCIHEVIKALRIQGETAIYCGRDTRKKFKLNGYSHVYVELKGFKKYNFLTSRFYSAVDIDYEMYKCNPTIVMITDLVFAQHSMIDPQSEATQIVGRLRKPSDKRLPFKREVVHITNHNEHLTSMSDEEVWAYINECHTVYKVVKRYYDASTTIASRETLRQMLTSIDYSKYVHAHSGARNYYMIDNLIHVEAIKGYYRLLQV